MSTVYWLVDGPRWFGGPLFLKLLGNRLPFKAVPAEFANLEVRQEETLPSLGATLLTILLPIALMLVKTIAELNMAKTGTLYMLLEFIGNPITAMFIAVFVATTSSASVRIWAWPRC